MTAWRIITSTFIKHLHLYITIKFHFIHEYISDILYIRISEITNGMFYEPPPLQKKHQGKYYYIASFQKGITSLDQQFINPIKK